MGIDVDVSTFSLNKRCSTFMKDCHISQFLALSTKQKFENKDWERHLSKKYYYICFNKFMYLNKSYFIDDINKNNSK